MTARFIQTGKGWPGLRGRKRGREQGGHRGQSNGFTLIELLVVLSIITLLATIAIPQYTKSVLRAREAALMENLYQMRVSLDKYSADNGKYPLSLETLVEKKYIRRIPVDPITESDETWIEVPTDEGDGVYDILSGSDKVGRNGKPYSDW